MWGILGWTSTIMCDVGSLDGENVMLIKFLRVGFYHWESLIVPFPGF